MDLFKDKHLFSSLNFAVTWHVKSKTRKALNGITLAEAEGKRTIYPSVNKAQKDMAAVIASLRAEFTRPLDDMDHRVEQLMYNVKLSER